MYLIVGSSLVKGNLDIIGLSLFSQYTEKWCPGKCGKTVSVMIILLVHVYTAKEKLHTAEGASRPPAIHQLVC